MKILLFPLLLLDGLAAALTFANTPQEDARRVSILFLGVPTESGLTLDSFRF